MRYLSFLVACALSMLFMVKAAPAIDYAKIILEAMNKDLSGRGIRPSWSASASSKKRQEPKRILAITLPLGSQDDRARCPPQQLACPITQMTFEQAVAAGPEIAYECVVPDEDILSCGGCSTMGTGIDCTAMTGAIAVGCKRGVCQVYACDEGFTLNGGECFAV